MIWDLGVLPVPIIFHDSREEQPRSGYIQLAPVPLKIQLKPTCQRRQEKQESW